MPMPGSGKTRICVLVVLCLLVQGLLAQVPLPIDWKTYPNPATDILNIGFYLPKAMPLEISILDIQGRVVVAPVLIEFVREEQLYHMDVSGLATGDYLLSLKGFGRRYGKVFQKY